MAAPNLIDASTITGNTAVQAVTTTPTAIVENSAASGKALKINALYISNIDSSNNADVSVDIFRSDSAYYVAKDISILVSSTLDLLNKPLYLAEGDSLRLTASADLDVHAVCSYEEIS